MLSERRLCFDPDSAAIEQNQTHLQLQSLHLSYVCDSASAHTPRAGRSRTRTRTYGLWCGAGLKRAAQVLLFLCESVKLSETRNLCVNPYFSALLSPLCSLDRVALLIAVTQ